MKWTPEKGKSETSRADGGYPAEGNVGPCPTDALTLKVILVSLLFTYSSCLSIYLRVDSAVRDLLKCVVVSRVVLAIYKHVFGALEEHFYFF